MDFRATLELGGKTATGIEVPADVIAALGSSKRPALSVTVNGYTYRTTVGSMGGRSMLPVSAEVRKAAGVEAGQELDVRVELDTAPRVVEVPPDLAEALTPDQRARFDALSYSGRRAHVLSVDGAKTPETRERRIAKVVEALTT